MLRIFDPEPDAAGPAKSPPSPDATSENESAGELEFVLGRRQVASLLFVVVVVLALVSGVSYLAGKAAAAKTPAPKEQAASASSETKSTEAVAPPAAPAASTATDAKAPTAAAPAAGNSSAGVNALLATDAAAPADESVFGEPLPGSLYVQVGALDRGPAMILTSGLRKRGFPAITARGPSADIFRVLVGPYKTLPEYQNAKEAISQMGISAFGRYGQ